jgi:large repetitive protein
VSVLYTVRDATKDPSRDVTGRLQYTVRDVPGKPVAPTFVEGDGTITVQWQAPATNGESIDHYTIACSGTGCPASSTVDGSAATKVFTGLTNGNSYTFRVTAHNALGDGAVSDASGTAKPFGTPSAPASATISASTDGNGTLDLNWGSSNGNGRDISGYRITLSDGQIKDTTGTGTSTTMTGHVGTSYTFTVTAKNSGSLQSPPSPTSNSAVPKPSAPTISAAQVGSTARFTFGAARSTDSITYSLSGSASGAVSAPGTKDVPGTYGQTYSVTITATSNGQSTSATASVKLVDPYSIQLCYGNPGPNGWPYLGVIWSGNDGSGHTIAFPGTGASTISFSAASGRQQSGAYHARDTQPDLNATITWTDNGATHQTRWGDAPAC